MFPSTYTWTAVSTQITTFLSEPMILGGVMFSIALAFVPRIVGMLKRSTRAR